MYPNSYLKYLNDNSVILKTQLSNEDYDDLLSENMVLLNVFHSSGFYPKFRVENSKNNIFHKPTIYIYTPSIVHGWLSFIFGLPDPIRTKKSAPSPRLSIQTYPRHEV